MFEQIITTDGIILLLALLFIVGVLTTKFSSRLGVPALVLFIVVGMLAGSDGLGLIYFDNPQHAQLIGMIALVIILFEGGMQTKWTTVRPVVAPSLILATVGVLLTTALVSVAAMMILNVTWLEGLLFGAIVGSTDAAAVFASLKNQNIKDNLEATLEAESGTNDPMAMFLTIGLVEWITFGGEGFFGLVGSFLWQMGMGLVAGLALGWVASWSINRVNLDSGGLYPVFALGFALFTYSVVSLSEASGLLAVYVAALVIGNSDLTYRHSIFRFNEGFAWMMQITMFVILGLLVFPVQLFTFDVIWRGILLAIILMFIARPVAVFLSTIGFGFGLKERVFISWAGLRGAVPIVLATYPMVAGYESSQLFFNVVFFVVLASALVQGSTISTFAEKLGLTGPKKVTPFHSLELVSIGQANAEIIEYHVPEDAAVVGRSLTDIEFPDDVLINAVIRDGDLITPYGETVIHGGDILYILVSRKSLKKLKRMLNDKKGRRAKG
ncbi:potassium/proton antiporter [Texcoconibacillus texcoconensis]|uniref:Cell volume regulation protein A n=1 Tax=Texcoconibacillus texcoconensis TaxID=1095777 RepID=A0A840QSC6_9BACI|nr:potassium/proton antiporter [Texcoconibacillus texcoconensis]MBB5174264.1 cell volume regulation protein A [Texcoconibacillus texcoconensis]